MMQGRRLHCNQLLVGFDGFVNRPFERQFLGFFYEFIFL